MSFLDPVKSSEVVNAVTLCNWAQANHGVPSPTIKDLTILNKKARELFEEVPGSDWQTIVQVVKWCHENKRRYARVWSYVNAYRHAWAAHAIDLPIENRLQELMDHALEVETHDGWRARLHRADKEHWEEVLTEWQTHRENLCDSVN